MSKFEIITRCTRLENLYKVRDSIFIAENLSLKIKWRIIIDISAISSINTKIISDIQKVAEINLWEGTPGDFGHQLINKAIDLADDESWIYVLDDDNLLNPHLLKFVDTLSSRNSIMRGLIVSQIVNGRDFTGLKIREASIENVHPQKIDMAQFILKKSLIGESRLKENLYQADGYFIEEIYEKEPNSFIFSKAPLSNYNAIYDEFPYTLPRIILMGNEDITLTTSHNPIFEATALNVKHCNNDNFIETLSSFDPDAIVSIGDLGNYTNLNSQHYDIRKRWIHPTNSYGDLAYNCAMHHILDTDKSTPLVSVFTPIYKTGAKINRTYDGLKNQTYTNWEWVVLNDSNDSTVEIIKEIAKKDSRVKLYNLESKSKGIIGEAKYRACALSRGDYLVELDHDDYLTPDALQLMLNAYTKFPDAKFVYSDCAELYEHNVHSMNYPEGFAFGYGKHRPERVVGLDVIVNVTPSVNPKTIRHIVGVANHFRSWERNFYFSIGGHNRRLSIADDYELIVRTFLKTRMVFIPKCCYLQFYHDSNSQDATRADIQRRVKSIALHYNDRIKLRFEELGVEDWAYHKLYNEPSRFGEDETPVNYVYSIESI